MRPIEDLRFIYARVVKEWVTDRKPQGPLLTDRCRKGHEAPARRADGECMECRRARRRKQRERIEL